MHTPRQRYLRDRATLLRSQRHQHLNQVIGLFLPMDIGITALLHPGSHSQATFSGRAVLRRYLPVRKPCASGDQGITAMP